MFRLSIIGVRLSRELFNNRSTLYFCKDKPGGKAKPKKGPKIDQCGRSKRSYCILTFILFCEFIPKVQLQLDQGARPSRDLKIRKKP